MQYIVLSASAADTAGLTSPNWRVRCPRKGCSPDNAACEGFFGRLKTEMIYPRNWRDVTLEDFVERIDGYIRWYNERRIKLSLGGHSPIKYRQALGLMAI